MDLALRHVSRRIKVTVTATVAVLLAFQLFFCWRWSREPPRHLESPASIENRATSGYATVSALINVVDWLLGKPGGYLSNDIYPPSVWLDNMPSFEFGVLVQVRGLSSVLRNDLSRLASDSTEHGELVLAESALNYTHARWRLPSTQSRMREAREALDHYRTELLNPTANDARFYARADGLSEWLAFVERRLGILSDRLVAKTPWLQIDNEFYEARGAAWALLQFMVAARQDFDAVLSEKNATVSLQSVIRELEGAIQPVRSPIIFNGGSYGLFANHSLVLASYLSRARAAVIDLRGLL